VKAVPEIFREVFLLGTMFDLLFHLVENYGSAEFNCTVCSSSRVPSRSNRKSHITSQTQPEMSEVVFGTF